MGFPHVPFRIACLCALFVAVPALACAEEMAPVALNSLSAAPSQAASAKVLDQHGNLLGQAQRIQTDQDGKPAALAFRAARDGSIVVVSAAAVSFDGNVLVADSDQPQVAALSGTRTASAQ
jgi:hypothetical protein